jgi:hypothetical protein
MNRPSRQAAVLIASLMVAASALASGDIYRCVDGAGKITLTDHQCAGNGGLLRAGTAGRFSSASDDIFGDTADEGHAARQSPEAARASYAVHAQPVTARMERWSSGLANVPKVDTDGETLRAARAAMHAYDSAAASMRQKRLAGVN